jgi:hypothetical protein
MAQNGGSKGDPMNWTRDLERKTLTAVLAVGFVAGMAGLAAASEAAGRWIHVRVVGHGDNQESVKVNLPLTMLETMADSIESDRIKDGRVNFGHSDLDAEQLRSLWKSVRDAQDMEFVTVESTDETVRVAKSGNYLLARIHDNDDRAGEKVEVKVPLDVVDALLSAPKGELNVKAAIQALARHGGGDLVTVRDGDSDMRVWIDSRAESD